MDAFKPARDRNARRFRDWPGSEKALGAKFEVNDRFVRTVDLSQYERLFRDRMDGSDFEALVELFEGPISSMFGDFRPHCIVLCIPDGLGDLRVENPGLSAKERRALEILKREEESIQGDLFAPTAEEMAEAETLRTTAEDLLFRTFYRAVKAKVHKTITPFPCRYSGAARWSATTTPGIARRRVPGISRPRSTTRPTACRGGRPTFRRESASSASRSTT
jgi:hypothetical protein